MRLTLRTLLAYLDDVLDPADATAIGQKVSQSEFSQQLVRRIRDVLRRRQLSAPEVTGPGARLDPNTVAEYLDNTLPPERVPEVEKICLESDAHLAEVAACHQVLSLVLTEAAEISPTTRERMYETVRSAVGAGPADRPREGVRRPAAVTPGPTASAGTLASESEFGEMLPDYLRPAPLWRRMLVPGAVTLCTLLLVLVVWHVWPHAQPDSHAPLAEAPVVGPGEKALVQQAEPRRPLTPLKPAAPGSPTPATPVPAGQPQQTPPTPTATQTSPAVTTMPGADTEPTPLRPPAGESAPTASVEPAPSPVVEAEVAPAPATTAPPSPAPELPLGADIARVRLEQPNRPERGVIALWSPEQNRWQRLPADARLVPGEHLVVLPSYRVWLELGSGGASVEVLGSSRSGAGTDVDPLYGTHLLLQEPSVGQVPELRLDFGRVVLSAIQGPTELFIALPDSAPSGASSAKWNLQLGQKGTRVGIEVQLLTPVGYDPERPVAYRAILHVQQGQLQLGGPQRPQSLIAPTSYVLAESGTAASATGALPPNIPAWMTEQERSLLQQRASRQLEPRLPFPPDQGDVTEGTLTLRLIEATQDRREEVQLLAVQCLATLGPYKKKVVDGVTVRVLNHYPLIDVLENARDEDVRREAIEGLRFWLAQGSIQRQDLREFLQREFKEHAAVEGGQLRYRLLWGYAPSEARQGDIIAGLLQTLNHQDLAVRELAIYNLLRLTGWRGPWNYHADDAPVGRERAALRWKTLYEQGSLLPRQPLR